MGLYPERFSVGQLIMVMGPGRHILVDEDGGIDA